jgi:putative hydrolase of the HAD superfamily
MNSAVDTLIFDLDDTLVVEELSAEAALIESGELARSRYGLDPHELQKTLRMTCRELWYGFLFHPYCKKVGISSWEGLWAEFTGEDPNLKALRNWSPTYRYKSWQTALRRHGIDDTRLAAELAEIFPRLRGGKHVLYADTLQALALLSNKYTLGLLTNGAPDLQRKKIAGAGLGGYFDQVLISGDVGIGKPDRRVFEIMLTRLKASPEATLMIGNSLITDVQGAQRAGMRAVWVNRPDNSRDDGIVPDWEISSLNELNSILAVASN